jgi:hypothetical protein
MIDEIKNILGLNWVNIHSFYFGGVRYHKAGDVCAQVSLSNPSVAVEKVSATKKRKFRTGEIEDGGERIQIRPWFVTDEGMMQMLMLNNTPETQVIKERVASRILCRVTQVG